MLVSIPPKYAVSQVVGYIKGKSAIHIARTYGGHRANFTGRISGPEGILYRPLVQTKLRSAPISPDKKKTIVRIDQMKMF